MRENQHKFFRTQPTEHADFLHDIMLRQQLQEVPTSQQWAEISIDLPVKFLYRQSLILHELLSDNVLFETYFQRFYSNHQKLQWWSSVEIEKKHTVQLYVFYDLLKKKVKEYQNYMKFQLQRKMRGAIPADSSSKKNQDCLTSKGNAALQDLFYYAQEQLESQKWKRRNRLRNLEKSPSDPHQFYQKTFQACQGLRYISYNYEKHMAALKMRRTYKMPQRMEYLKKEAEKISTGCMLVPKMNQNLKEEILSQNSNSSPKINICQQLHKMNMNDCQITWLSSFKRGKTQDDFGSSELSRCKTSTNQLLHKPKQKTRIITAIQNEQSPINCQSNSAQLDTLQNCEPVNNKKTLRIGHRKSQGNIVVSPSASQNNLFSSNKDSQIFGIVATPAVSTHVAATEKLSSSIKQSFHKDKVIVINHTGKPKYYRLVTPSQHKENVLSTSMHCSSSIATTQSWTQGLLRGNRSQNFFKHYEAEPESRLKRTDIPIKYL